MLNTNTLFGYALAIAITAIGTHAWDTHSTKTNLHPITYTQTQPTDSSCVQRACPAPQVVVNEKPEVNPAPVTADVPVPVARPTINEKTSAKKKPVLVKAHHHKSKVSHHHKSKHHHHHGGNHHHHHGGNHHHHHGGHHGGHHHHSAPHTGPPGCR